MIDLYVILGLLIVILMFAILLGIMLHQGLIIGRRIPLPPEHLRPKNKKKKCTKHLKNTYKD